MKTALLYIDGGFVKIVHGLNFKYIKLNEVNLLHNSSFLSKLFDTHSVVGLESVTELTKESFESWLEAETPEEPEPKPQQKPEANRPVVSKRAAEIIQSAQEESKRVLFRSLAKTTITIDDLYTNEEVPGAPGIKQTLAVFPHKAIDLSVLPQESVQKSAILRKLIRDGILVPCSSAEAQELFEDHDRKTREDNDARLNHDAPLIDRKVEDFVVGSSKQDKEFAEIEEIEEGPSAPALSETGEYSLDQLLKITGASGDGGTQVMDTQAPPAPPKRQLATRPSVPSSGLSPRGTIKRRAGESN